MIVFSGDIGGTSTRMQLTEFKDNKLFIQHTAHYHNNDFPNFASIIDTFFSSNQIDQTVIQGACFAVAGPIVKGCVKFTNLPWTINENDIKAKLNLTAVALINDFEGIGYGIETLTENDLEVIQPGKPRPKSIKAFIGAGTGLGVGFMTFHNDSYSVYPTEGGHMDFAPTTENQIKLLQYLLKKYHRISYERVLSGQGLINIYKFVRDNKKFGEEENPQLRFLLESDKNIDVAATIAEFAIGLKDIAAQRALEMFIRIYGAAAGNLALSTLPYSGLYIVGGIAPKLISQLKEGDFMTWFYDKGRMSNLLQNIPIYIVKNTDVGLQGAAVYARRLKLANVRCGDISN